MGSGRMDRNGNNLKPFKCPRCGSEQARTNGVDIYFGVRKVPLSPLSLSWLCKMCHAVVKWRPTTPGRNGLPQNSI